MATNLALDPDLLDRAFAIGGARTKKETVTLALQEFITRREQAQVVELFGTLDWDADYDPQGGAHPAVILLVDTSVWSQRFRRDRPGPGAMVEALHDALVNGGSVATTGIVVQELLQGLHGPKQRAELSRVLRTLPVITPTIEDHVEAGDVFRACRRRGIQLGTVDALLAAICIRRDLTILTADQDLHHAQRAVSLRVWSSDPP